MAVIKKDRELFSLWDTDKSKAEHIEGVVLEVRMLNQTTGYLELTYEFDGWGSFSEELQTSRTQSYERPIVRPWM